MTTVVRIATSKEKEVIQNIDQFYLYEFSRFMPAFYKLGDDGLFHDEDYAPYWDDEDKYPYLILHNEEKAGFALVEDKGEECVLAQFFILYKFQGSLESCSVLSPDGTPTAISHVGSVPRRRDTSTEMHVAIRTSKRSPGTKKY